MIRYARINKLTGEKEKEYPATRFRGDPPVFQNKPWIWLPIVETQPPHDRATHISEGPAESRIGDEWHKVWTVRALTSAELNQRKDAQLFPNNSVHFRLAFNLENRVRKLEGKQPISPNQYRTFLRNHA